MLWGPPPLDCFHRLSFTRSLLETKRRKCFSSLLLGKMFNSQRLDLRVSLCRGVKESFTHFYLDALKNYHRELPNKDELNKIYDRPWPEFEYFCKTLHCFATIPVAVASLFWGMPFLKLQIVACLFWEPPLFKLQMQIANCYLRLPILRSTPIHPLPVGRQSICTAGCLG